MAERKRIHRLNQQVPAFDVKKIVEEGIIRSELDYERAKIADRKLRLLVREDAKLKSVRISLRGIIEAYEKKHWKNEEVSREKIRENDLAEFIAEKERSFLATRKELIKDRLKKRNMTQQHLGQLLNHPGKSYMSELINGISPFSMKDLTIISLVLKIEMSSLVPTFLPASDRRRIITVIKKQKNPKLKIEEKDLVLA